MNRTFSFLTAALAVVLIGTATVRVHTDSSQASGAPSTGTTSATVSADAPQAQTTAAKTGGQQTAGGTTRKEKSAKGVDADRAYKANCTRCHSELPKLEPRAMKTVVMHMRVRANLTDAEARAIAEYLTR